MVQLIAPATASEPPVVDTEGGRVTLLSVDAMESWVYQLDAWLKTSVANEADLQRQASDKRAAAGAILVPRSNEWDVPPALQGTLEQARALVAEIKSGDDTTESLKEQESHGNVLGRIGAWRQVHSLSHDRESKAGELSKLLIEIATAAPATGVAEAETERQAASGLEAEAGKLGTEIDQTRAKVASLNEEISRRKAAIAAMGFDALYEAAQLKTSGPTPVESPLILKAGETAFLSVSATLSRIVRRTHYVGGSSGFSFPIGHTGIRYRVGSFSGHPVEQESLTRLDAGTFVLTGQRLAFIGHAKSISMPLDKVLHVEVYNDAIAVFKEGRENPDFFLMSEPKHALFLLNWLLGTKDS